MDTPFPFPWSQLVLVLVLSFAVLLPFMVADFVYDIYYCVLLDFFSVLIYWSLAEVARDLEDPFVYDPNNLPLARLQFAFNERIIALTHNLRPNSTLETSSMHVVILPELQRRVSTESHALPVSVFAEAQHSGKQASHPEGSPVMASPMGSANGKPPGTGGDNLHGNGEPALPVLSLGPPVEGVYGGFGESTEPQEEGLLRFS